MYCRDSSRRQEHEHIQFNFLGYGFRPREAKSRRGKVFTSFLPAISMEAKAAIMADVRDWHIHRMSHVELDDLARMFNAKIRGCPLLWQVLSDSALANLPRIESAAGSLGTRQIQAIPNQ